MPNARSTATPGLRRTARPFQFCTQLHLEELTGLRASNLAQLRELIRTMPGAAIYYHTHQFLQQYQLLTPEPPNDFNFWVRNALGNRGLAEQLASIDTVQFSTIRSLRIALVRTIDAYLAEHPTAQMAFAPPGEEFHVIKAVSIVLPTPHVAHDLVEFRVGLSQITVQSIYFHMFEANLRLDWETNDCSAWLHEELGEDELAAQFRAFDPYTITLEELRQQLLALVDARLAELGTSS